MFLINKLERFYKEFPASEVNEWSNTPNYQGLSSVPLYGTSVLLSPLR